MCLLGSVITPLCGFLLLFMENLLHAAWNHLHLFLTDRPPRVLQILILHKAFWILLCVFTVSLRVEDNHRGGGGRVEGFVHQQQLFCSGEGGREWRQFFECYVGWQSGVKGQHGRYDAVGQQALWLNTENRRNSTLLNVPSPWTLTLMTTSSKLILVKFTRSVNSFLCGNVATSVSLCLRLKLTGGFFNLDAWRMESRKVAPFGGEHRTYIPWSWIFRDSHPHQSW